MTRELMEHFTGKDLYFVFPEAEGNPAYFRPDWSASRRRLAAILEALQKLNPAQIEDYHAQFVMPHVPQFLLEKLEPTQLASAAEVVAGELAQIEVMIETLDYVLNHDRPQEFLLRWSV
jgi:hypothetical protein